MAGTARIGMTVEAFGTVVGESVCRGTRVEGMSVERFDLSAVRDGVATLETILVRSSYSLHCSFAMISAIPKMKEGTNIDPRYLRRILHTIFYGN